MDNNQDDLFLATREELKRQKKDVMNILNISRKGIGDIAEQFMNGLNKLQGKWNQRIAGGGGVTGGQVAIEQVMGQITFEAMAGATTELVFDSDESFNAQEHAEEFAREYTSKFAKNFTDTTRDNISEMIGDAVEQGKSIDEAKREIEEQFEDWEQDRAESVARTETQRATNMGTERAFKEAGVKTKEWLTATDPCEFCAKLDGLRISVGEAFLETGDNLPGVENGTYNVQYSKIETPPLHPRCRCTIIASQKAPVTEYFLT